MSHRFANNDAYLGDALSKPLFFSRHLSSVSHHHAPQTIDLARTHGTNLVLQATFAMKT